jgi:aspartate racemase
MRKLGLIGGLGPAATVYYYQQLAKSNPGEALVIHADMQHALSFVTGNDIPGLARYFAGLIQRLADAGCDFAAISAVTPHICIRELIPISPLPLIDITAEIRKAILARGYRSIAMFGTRFVVESSMFGMLEGIRVRVPSAPQIMAIHEAYMSCVNEDPVQARETLIQIARDLPVDAVILAGTDLSPVFNEDNTPFPYMDASAVHIEALLNAIHS